MKTCGFSSASRRALLAATLLLGMAAFNHQGWGQEKPSPLIGQPAPAFQVQGIYGERYSIETFKGHILVMQFGASW